MQKEQIIEKLREQGCRITRQRRILLDVILEEECACCKEVYYKASKIDNTIGTATVYRMINTLEDIGAISRNSMYRITCDEEECDGKCATCQDMCPDVCEVEFLDGSKMEFTSCQWKKIIESGIEKCGYRADAAIKSVSAPVL